MYFKVISNINSNKPIWNRDQSKTVTTIISYSEFRTNENECVTLQYQISHTWSSPANAD